MEPQAPPPVPRSITDQEFSLFQSLVEQEAGIHLGPTKQALLMGRLSRRVGELGLPSFGAYYRYVTTPGHEVERMRMLDCLCTHETHFFREPQHFDFLCQRVLPEWVARASAGGPRRVRVWSAACSTGEEPYSLAMLLLAHLPPWPGWEVEVLATDLSHHALERARQGLWPVEGARRIPPPLLRAYMLEGVRRQQGWMKAGPELRSVLRFTRVNLNDERTWPAGPFDLIFCRNVLIYFGAEARARALQALLRRLPPEGYLFLGHAESFPSSLHPVRCVAPNVYARAPSTSRSHP